MASATKIYLVLYNAVQLFGWATILTEIIRCVVTKEGLWTVSGPGLKIFQTLAILEIFHAAFGLVKSSASVTSMQVFSRVFLVWAVLNYSPESRNSVGFPMLLTAWTLVEVIRYGFYLASLLKLDSYPLTWLRYSAFLGLYPLGVTGEMIATCYALPKIAKEKPFALPTEGEFNWAYWAVILVLLSYIPAFPMLFGHMLKQRKKTLGAPVPAGKKQKTK